MTFPAGVAIERFCNSGCKVEVKFQSYCVPLAPLPRAGMFPVERMGIVMKSSFLSLQTSSVINKIWVA